MERWEGFGILFIRGLDLTQLWEVVRSLWEAAASVLGGQPEVTRG